MRIRGRTIYFVYLGMVMGSFYFLNAYLWRKQLHHHPLKRQGFKRTYTLDYPGDDQDSDTEFGDKAVVMARVPLKHDRRGQSFNKQLITAKIPKVGYVPGNSTEAEKLFHTVRVICWIPTSPYLFFKRSIYVLQTWGKRCNKLVFFVSKSKKDPSNWQRSLTKSGSIFTDLDHNHYAQENLEFIELDSTEKGTYDLSKKVFASWEHLSKHHGNEADWFIKVDDDTYVIMENLRYFLSKQDPHKPVYFGHKFIVNKHQYHSGGAGYVMSRQTLDYFVQEYHSKCPIKSGIEDMQMGDCMKRLGIETGVANDEKNRAYFYPLGPIATLTGEYPKWFSQYDKVSSKHEGIIGFPRLPISFHYVGQQKMQELELFIYYIQVYGGALGEDTEEAFAGGIVHTDTSFSEEQKDDREDGGMRLKVEGHHANDNPFGRLGHIRAIDRDKAPLRGGDVKAAYGNILELDSNNRKANKIGDSKVTKVYRLDDSDALPQDDQKIVQARAAVTTDYAEDDNEDDDLEYEKQIKILKQFFPDEYRKLGKIMKGAPMPQGGGLAGELAGVLPRGQAGGIGGQRAGGRAGGLAGERGGGHPGGLPVRGEGVANPRLADVHHDDLAEMQLRVKERRLPGRR